MSSLLAGLTLWIGKKQGLEDWQAIALAFGTVAVISLIYHYLENWVLSLKIKIERYDKIRDNITVELANALGSSKDGDVILSLFFIVKARYFKTALTDWEIWIDDDDFELETLPVHPGFNFIHEESDTVVRVPNDQLIDRKVAHPIEPGETRMGLQLIRVKYVGEGKTSRQSLKFKGTCRDVFDTVIPIYGEVGPDLPKEFPAQYAEIDVQVMDLAEYNRLKREED